MGCEKFTFGFKKIFSKSNEQQIAVFFSLFLIKKTKTSTEKLEITLNEHDAQKQLCFQVNLEHCGAIFLKKKLNKKNSNSFVYLSVRLVRWSDPEETLHLI